MNKTIFITILAIIASFPTLVEASNYYPPRIQQICNDSFIGYEYNPKLEKRCRVLWIAWSDEIKKSLADYQR